MVKQNRVYITIGSLLVFMALVLGLYVYQTNEARHQRFVYQSFNGTLLKQPREIVTFALEGTNGVPFNNQSLKNHWTMMFFGFTQCGSICPTTLAELSKMMTILHKQKVALPQVVMISVDPERDSLEQLTHYLHSFNHNFIGARGHDEVVAKLTKDMGIAYTKIAMSADSESNYNIDHTGTIILLNPQGKLAGFFTMPHQASALAKDYLLVV